MGQHLSEPVTTKETDGVANSQYRCASSSMQGWRISMEDAHTHILSMKEDKDAAFFAVFDGHGGSSVAHYGGEHLHKDIFDSDLYRQGKYTDAIQKGFLACDENMQFDDSVKDETAGAAAVSVLIKDKKMYCGNCGDSRAIACVSGVAQELSYDHKPSNEGESRRIVSAGGWVEFNRVNGNLALSRALGDYAFKRNSKKPAEEQIVTAFPDVIIKEILPEHEFILIACDGIWDVMDNQEVADFVRQRIASKTPPEQICEELLDHCLAPDCQMGGLGCDNMTAVLVCLLNEQSYEELAEKCSTPVRPEILEKYNSEHGSDIGVVTPPSTDEQEDSKPNGEGEEETLPSNEDEEQESGQMDEEEMNLT